MESLDNTDWDVLIVGTGLQQSILALYVYLCHRYLTRNLTDVVLEELCHARAKTFSMLMPTPTTAVLQLLSA